MILKTSSDKEYVSLYVRLLQNVYGFTNRETEVAIAIVYRYCILDKAKDQLSKPNREKFNTFAELKKPEVLKLITKELKMDFLVFKTYLSNLRDKGFFKNHELNLDFVPPFPKAKIEIWIN